MRSLLKLVATTSMLLLFAVSFTACEEKPEPVNPNDGTEESDIPEEGIPYAKFVSSTYRSIVVDTKLNGYNGAYYITLYPRSLFESEFKSNAQALASAYIEQELTEWGGDLSVENNLSVFNTEQTVDLSNVWVCYGDTDYVVFTFGIDSQGVIITDVAMMDAKTEDFPLASITVGTKDVTFDDISLKLTPTSKDETYLVFPLKKSDYISTFNSMPETTVTSMISGLLTQGIDPLTVDGIRSFKGDATVDLSSGWVIEPNTEYVVFAVHLDSKYSQSSRVTALEVIVPDYSDIEGEIASVEISDVTYSDAMVSVDAGDFPGIYYVAPFLQDEFVEDFNSDIDAVTDFMIGYESDRDMDFSTADGLWLFTGDSEIKLSDSGWNIQPDNEYFVLAFGVLPNGRITTEVVKSEIFRTKSSAAFNLNISVGSITDNGAVFTLTPNLDDLTYAVAPIEKSIADGKTDKELEDFMEVYYGGVIEIIGHLMVGDNTKDFTGKLKSGVEYIAVGGAYQAGLGLVSSVTKVPFKTTGEIVPDVTIPETIVIPTDVEFGTIAIIELMDQSVKYRITPNNLSESYFSQTITESLYNRYSSPEEIVADDLYYIQLDANRENMSFGAYLSQEAYQGTLDITSYLMSSQTGGYAIYAYGMDLTTAQPTTEVKVFEFSVNAPVAAPMKISPIGDLSLRTKRFPVEQYNYNHNEAVEPITPALVILSGPNLHRKSY